MTTPQEQVQSSGMGRIQNSVKRVIDFFVAVSSIIIFSPLIVICYILIKLEDGGPAIFSQERIGRYGKPFRIYKFRTMEVDAEKEGPMLYQHENDQRITRIGKFLRSHHLDELPQLFNVLFGDMSFVGPRPERKYFIDKIMELNSDYQYIYLMRPGTTSLATLYNGYTDTMEKMLIRLQMDLDYLQKRSLWLDLKIMFITAKFMFFGKKF